MRAGANLSDAGSPFADANPKPYWFTTLADIPPCPALETDISCELAVIGGGFTGLWSALKARERHPDARIILVEATRCGQEASGRNGGFCAPSISHGVSNALARWPDEAETLIRLGRANLDDLERDLVAHDIDAEFHRPGKLTLAATPWQINGLHDLSQTYQSLNIPHELLTGDALHTKFKSPSYQVGLFEPNYALVNPVKLVDGLRETCLRLGIEIYESTPVTRILQDGTHLQLITPQAMIRSHRVILATNAAPPLMRSLRNTVVPIFDYSLVTEPLSDAQLAEIGWTGPHGAADSGNQFHYLRKTADNRILWAGFDAIYHYGSNRDPILLQRDETFARLARHFVEAFPSLADVRFDYKWGGIIDTSARTTFFVGTALSGQLSYAMGFTGQGVSASRFAALTMLDFLDGVETERTTLDMIRRRPVRFPVEPLRSLGIRLAQNGLASEDNTGRRALFLKILDKFGVGFDS